MPLRLCSGQGGDGRAFRYHQLVREISQEPDYEEVLAAVNSIK